MSPEVLGLLIPMVMFVSLAVVLGLFLLFRLRAKQAMQETIRAAIERGQELSPEIIERLGSPAAPKDRDLRRGIISIAVAIAIAIFGFSVNDADAFGAMLGLSAFPFLLGGAFLLMHFLGSKD